MKSCEAHINYSSDYFIYSPSTTAQNIFFFPVCTGHFIYERGYRQYRNSYDSFLLMYIQSGKLTLDINGQIKTAYADEFVLIDCYQPHGYSSNDGCECIWCHFDGPTARGYYNLITSHLGNTFTLSNSYPVIHKLTKIYNIFSKNEPIREAYISKQISDILTALILETPEQANQTNHTSIIEEATSYINEHLVEELSIQELAERALLSTYHFIRVFKKETGFTPHQYIINLRIDTAKYMLNATQLSIKDICFRTGFSSECAFCTSFKKNVGVTPIEYRTNSN